MSDVTAILYLLFDTIPRVGVFIGIEAHFMSDGCSSTSARGMAFTAVIFCGYVGSHVMVSTVVDIV